ncbi:hypothetical protein JW916_03315, partial [Candidatus Sumerlaeota bacterium]|nr:hypothetical protein [Candidatus Sumerlaeota bacterium]
MKRTRLLLLALAPFLFLTPVLGLSSCSRAETRRMEVTAYCGCGKCCGWERGRWLYLKLDFWNRYVSTGPRRGKPYDGRTASGTWPHEPRAGLFSPHSLTHPWMIPVRVVFFPWLLLGRDGTLAADTRHYDLGTRIYPNPSRPARFGFEREPFRGASRFGRRGFV